MRRRRSSASALPLQLPVLRTLVLEEVVGPPTGQRRLRITYFRRENANSGEMMIVQTSTDLQNWVSLAAAGGTEQKSPGPISNGEASVYQWEGTVPAAGTRIWVRLKATR